jgi:hypothetical protein
MTEQRWVEFDYERYKAGDEVFYRSGEKFEGDLFLSEKRIISNDPYPIISAPTNGIAVECYTVDGIFNISKSDQFKNDLIMKPKITKLWIAVWKDEICDGVTHRCSHGHANLEKLKSNYSHNGCHFIQIEVEE